MVNAVLLMLFTAFAFVPETIRHLTDNHEYWKKAAEDWVRVFVSDLHCVPFVDDGLLAQNVVVKHFWTLFGRF